MRLRAFATYALVSMACRQGTTSETHATGPRGARVSAGATPRERVVDAPERVTSHGNGTYNKMGGCGFDVDWGDGADDPGRPGISCASLLHHTYASGGTYRVKVSTYRILPTDGWETDWVDVVSVLVP
jgi:hypothetical protein